VPAPDFLSFAAPFAYVGLGPGQEMIPYFLALLGLVGTALATVFRAPLAALRRSFFRSRTRNTDERTNSPGT
jgi:hypothetical protein